MRKIVALFLLSLLGACGADSDYVVNEAVIEANLYLSKNKCDPAINVLESVGRQNTNAAYLKTLASAYACRAGYSTITFFSSDLALTAAPVVLGGMSRYSTSSVTSGPSTTDDLQKAINILLYAGDLPLDQNPTSTARSNYFSTGDLGDIHSQLVYMVMVQLGRYLRYYGDGNAAGVKAGGPLTSKCLTNYVAGTPLSTLGSVGNYLTAGGLTGACNSTTSAHPELDGQLVNLATRVKRLCQGAVLLNNLLALLPAVITSLGGNMSAAATAVSAAMTLQKAVFVAEYAAGAAVANVTSQTKCEADNSGSAIALEAYFALMFETMYQ